jgi:hypothetical protein
MRAAADLMAVAELRGDFRADGDGLLCLDAGGLVIRFRVARQGPESLPGEKSGDLEILEIVERVSGGQK